MTFLFLLFACLKNGVREGLVRKQPQVVVTVLEVARVGNVE